jgi:hypothetical protein
MSDNPYSDDQQIEPRKAGAVSVEESRAMAEVKAQVFMARQFPRDVVKATDRILVECDRLKLAEKAVYTFPRGTSTVTGPSIRLAEAIKRAWGNMMSGLVEVERNEKESAMLAYAWDLETNTMRRVEFKVPHTRDASEYRDGAKVKVKKLLTDDRDVYEMTANQGARRERACILGLIPGDVVEAAVKRCEKTLVAKVGKLEEVIPKMVTKFAAIGVTKAMIEKRLGHHLDTTQPAEVVQLGNIFTSIEDGMAVVKDFFEPEGEPKAPEDVVKTAGGAGTPTATTTTRPGEDSADLWASILEYGAADDLPGAAKKDIQAAVDRDEKDPILLRALLNKVKASYDGRKK